MSLQILALKISRVSYDCSDSFQLIQYRHALLFLLLHLLTAHNRLTASERTLNLSAQATKLNCNLLFRLQCVCVGDLPARLKFVLCSNVNIKTLSEAKLIDMN